jgi:hypothetical protein
MTKINEKCPAVVVDSGASYEEPIPFAGIVEIEPDYDDLMEIDDIVNKRTNPMLGD